ncbi:transcription factor S-II, central domain-containing protein [Ochromonadaceae sp. CCMP2298]|nr:transcription factor S-II, central domain-containing protein [Ochromonadaceae sp. CCMP2298]|mmetsp:Transcript_32178/g.70900  ORF Transcript_32178/g.70900 Transcript_32178/m.70900 type:complete len:329 (-) Transcript_32178:106-1092(-)|eukprot:CAMPEP_0173228996 /NCGR_PEP_ID=MMETSP1142-20121109/6849_1 /TAXON_ID=483371 /ORGANISM="non described non described, Strain CCMP2298" /LENGTH=328 /DNA_ID=CAMNT_0014157725 /DNA_START=180 /DNA_END=1166 /DNA_ORIENTATION=+
MEDRGALGVRNIKKELEKLMEDAGGATEQAIDLLCALEKLSLSAQIIKDMKLGPLLSNLNKKFKDASPQLGEKVKAIMGAYKKILFASTSALGTKQPSSAAVAAASSETATSKSTEGQQVATKQGKEVKDAREEGVAFIKPVASESSSGLASSSATENGSAAGKSSGGVSAAAVPAMNELRRMILSMFQRLLVESGSLAAQADATARKIEAALNANISSVTSKNPYSNKAKSLIFNLKKNQGLCANVAAGTITGEQLVTLSAADLASHDQRVTREKLQAQQLQSRRTDWLEENKKSLQADIGIDPNNTWQYDDDDERMSEPDADPPDI